MEPFEKGTPQWELFAELFSYCKKYYMPGPTIDYWKGMMNDGNELIKKYQEKDAKTGCLAKHLLYGFSDYLEEIGGCERGKQ